MLGYYHSNVLRSIDNIYNWIVLFEGAGRQHPPGYSKLRLGRSELKNWLEGLEAQRVLSFLLFTLKKLLGNSPSPFLPGRGCGKERFYGTTWSTTNCPLGEQQKAFVLSQGFRNVRRADFTIPGKRVKSNKKARIKERDQMVS